MAVVHHIILATVSSGSNCCDFVLAELFYSAEKVRNALVVLFVLFGSFIRKSSIYSEPRLTY